MRHLVELHGGEVQASSRGRGQGATFTLSLPLRAVAMGFTTHIAKPVDPAELIASVANLASARK